MRIGFQIAQIDGAVNLQIQIRLIRQLAILMSKRTLGSVTLQGRPPEAGSFASPGYPGFAIIVKNVKSGIKQKGLSTHRG